MPPDPLRWKGGRALLRGVVDRVVPDGKFGFIIGPNGEEYFFHQSALKETEFGDLGPGVPVEFNAEDQEAPGDRRSEHLRAVNVRLADDAVPAVENEPLPPEKAVGPAYVFPGFQSGVPGCQPRQRPTGQTGSCQGVSDRVTI